MSEELDHVRLCVVEGGVKDALCHLMVTDRGGGGCWLPPRTPSHSFVPEPRFGCKKGWYWSLRFISLTRELPGVALVNCANSHIFTII